MDLLRVDGWVLLLLPITIFLATFFLYPLLFMVFRSVPDWDFVNYKRLFGSTIYLNVLITTFKVSLLTTTFCLLLGYPYAYVLTQARGGMRTVLTLSLFLPFWISVLLRTFSWLIILQDTGIVNQALLSWGLIEKPLPLVRSLFGVSVGMVHILLPYMVLPLSAVMRGVNPNLMEAARISGASGTRCFFRIYLPQTVPGILAGAVLTLTLSLGFYITPAILGGVRDTMIAQLIADQISKQVNFAFSSALAVALIGFTAVAFAILAFLLRLTRHRLGESR